MSIQHCLPGEIINIQPYGPDFSSATSATLIRENHLEVFRYVLKAGKITPEHTAAGAMTLQCIEGEVALVMAKNTQILRAQQLIYLTEGDAHSLRALTDTTLLVTLLLRRK